MSSNIKCCSSICFPFLFDAIDVTSFHLWFFFSFYDVLTFNNVFIYLFFFNFCEFFDLQFFTSTIIIYIESMFYITQKLATQFQNWLRTRYYVTTESLGVTSIVTLMWAFSYYLVVYHFFLIFQHKHNYWYVNKWIDWE